MCDAPSRADEGAAHIGDDFVAVRRHQTRSVDQDAMELRGVREAIPIHLLHLSRFVRLQEDFRELVLSSRT